MHFLRRLYGHYHAYHAYGPPRLKYMGYVGVFTAVLFYFLRFTRPGSALFDDLPLRMVSLALFIGLALKDQWPERLKPYYIGYSYAALLFCLPYFTVLVALQRGGGIPSMSNAFIILCFLVLLTDWRNTLVMLAVGIGLASVTYWTTSPDPRVPMDLVAQLPAYALIVVGGNLFSFSTEQIEAERRLRATQALAGTLAHELRHPLSQLKHGLDGIRDILPAPGAGSLRPVLDESTVDGLYRHVAEGNLAVRRGLQVISMTLDEVSARPIDTASFSYLSAAETTQKALQEFVYDAADARDRVSLRVEQDFTFRGEETAYLFVLFNLIKNALYYVSVRPGTRVEVTVAAREVRVRDTGPGMAPAVLANLFEPFHSVGKSGGTGLGLAYCKRVMEAFGGEIACVSELGAFTEFSLRFPAVTDDEIEAHRLDVLAAARTVLQGKRLLLVDDEATQRQTTRQKLLPLGLQVEEAADGRQALDLLAKRPFDLMLLDLVMPTLDGYAVASRVRQKGASANPEVRIVAYSSEPMQLAEVKVQKARMDVFLGKPASQVAISRALQQALRQPVQGGAHLAGRRIVLADDSSYSRRAVAAYLREAGAAVFETETGAGVLDTLRAQAGIDAVLLDINMPGMSGLETTRAVRAADAPWSQVPIVALTARSEIAVVQAAQEAGMAAFLVKPVDAVALYQTLATVVEHTGATLPAPLQPQETEMPASALLNLQRLQSYQRLHMLDELLSDYLPEIRRLVANYETAAARADTQLAQDALHSLLGLSGEAGALALYQMVRSAYLPLMEEQRWPEPAGWLQQLKNLAARTEEALNAYAQECRQAAES